MSELYEKLAIRALGLIGGYPTFATDKAKLRALLQALRPMSAGIELTRIGAAGDGGYLVPNDLAGIEACFSPGVADCSEFEQACAERGMPVFLADASVDGPATAHPRFHFTKKYIGAITRGDFMTMEDWVAATPLAKTRGDLMLQMDIEGYEYQVFMGLPATLMARFRVMVVEFHDLPRLFSLPYFSLVSTMFEKILQTHLCVHLHPNNLCGVIAKDGVVMPRLMEFTFLRRDRIKTLTSAAAFPHPLDAKNDPTTPDIPLPRCWQGG